jgi:aspartate/methionine/tyrosine aminotransferase
MQYARRLDSVSEYYFSSKLQEVATLREVGHDVINLGIGSPDLAPSPDVIKILQEDAAKSDAHSYQPYKGLPGLRSEIANFFRRNFNITLNPDTEVLPLMGSKEGIMHISMAMLNPGDRVLIPELSYPTYTSVSRLMEADIDYFPLLADQAFAPDWSFFDNYNFARTRIIWINYPHMPTGQSASQETLQKFVDLAKRHDLLLVHDNPYSFLSDDPAVSIFSIPGARDLCLELHSISKTFNMAGWRVGWVCGSAAHIDAVLRVKSNMDSGMFRPIQVAAAHALRSQERWFEDLRATYRQRRAVAMQLADLLHMQCLPGQSGMFVWGKIEQDAATRVDQLLHDYHVFLAPGHIFGQKGRNYLRISLCNTEQRIGEAIERIK